MVANREQLQEILKKANQHARKQAKQSGAFIGLQDVQMHSVIWGVVMAISLITLHVCSRSVSPVYQDKGSTLAKYAVLSP